MTLEDRVARGGSADEAMDWFLGWVKETGLAPYAAQEEAILELYSKNNVILATPTGSGKSLVAMAACFLARCEGKRAVYTVPIRALANEKFFALCKEFGAANVGLLTGDASVNAEAPIVCCTAEILASMALREGANAPADVVVMDEFHFYSDKERGVAWQTPLLVLEKTQFLLMSATMGDTTSFEERITALTGRPTTTVRSTERPVPLDFSYSEIPLQETVLDLLRKGHAPIYIVGFTQRAAAETAQNLMSIDVIPKDKKKEISAALEGFRFASPYGSELSRFVKHGIGVHHAGLLPRYRRLVERLTQKGLLEIVCGTDTLGVGVNVPIRTVLLTQLCKYDGNKTVILSARDFHQISGRAGRAGFDVRGSVVVQAPEHVIENLRMESRAAGDKAKMRKIVKRKPPEHGYVHWDRSTFDRLVISQPEPLVSRFRVSHGMLLEVLSRSSGGCLPMARLVRDCHELEPQKKRLAKMARQMLGSLLEAGIVGPEDGMLRVHADLQEDFSLHHALSLYLVETIGLLDKEAPDYAADVLTLCESILEDPEVVLRAQISRLKGQKVAEMKMAGASYEERMEELEKIEHPKPKAEFIDLTFRDFSKRHPWVMGEIRPKGVAREILETLSTFGSFIKEYDIRRSEGVLLRYLSDVYKTLVQTVPDPDKTEGVRDIIGFFRAIVRQVDSSLLDEWEAMRSGAPRETHEEPEPASETQSFDDAALVVLVRNECFGLVRALSWRDWRLASELSGMPPHVIEAAMKPYFEEHTAIRTDAEARGTRMLDVEKEPTSWRVRQTLLDPDGFGEWHFAAKIDLARAVSEGRITLEVTHLGR
jgi:superfamily II RNA helicase